MTKITISVFIVLTLALVLVGQQPVEVRRITAAATGTQVAASSDSVVCATDLGCVVKQATGSNLHMVVDSGTVTAVTAITNALPAGTNYLGGVRPWADGTLKSGGTASAMTGTTSTSVVAGLASNYYYATNCTVSNSSLTVSTDISIQDGSGGTIIYNLPAPAAAVATTGGGGSTFVFPTPLKVPTIGNGLFAANVTTGSSTKVYCNGFYSTTTF
jgi:hypothetical protein